MCLKDRDATDTVQSLVIADRPYTLRCSQLADRSERLDCSVSGHSPRLAQLMVSAPMQSLSWRVFGSVNDSIG